MAASKPAIKWAAVKSKIGEVENNQWFTMKKYSWIAIATIIIAGGFLAYPIITGNASNTKTVTGKDRLSFKQAMGQKAPDFTLLGIDGNNVKLSDYGGKNVVLFFTEGSMCYPACWDQMAAFGNDERFNNENTVVFFITPDQRSEWQQIIKKMPKLAKAKILFDTTRAVSSSYDVLSLPSSMHRGSYPGHTYFVIDKDGIVRYNYDDPLMAIQNDKIAAQLNKLS